MDLDESYLVIEEPSADLIALNDALAKLVAEDVAVANLVKLRYFAGLTLEESAKILGISKRAADRHWAYARAWLHQEITEGNGRTSG